MIKIIEENEPLKTERLTILIFGEPGIGKTSLAYQTNNPILFDFDNGAQRAIGRKKTIRVDAWNDIIEYIESKDFNEPKNVIIDTAGTMLDNYISEFAKTSDPKNRQNDGTLTMKGWGKVGNIFKDFCNSLKAKNCNIIFIAHAQAKEVGNNIQFQPKMSGGSQDVLRQEADLIGFIESISDKRVIDFAPCDRHIGKDCAQLGKINIPNYESDEYDGFLQGIIEKTLEKMNALSEKQQKAVKEIQDFKSSLEDEELDESAINKFYKGIVDSDDSGTIKRQKISILAKIAKKNNVVFDRETKSFKTKNV